MFIHCSTSCLLLAEVCKAIYMVCSGNKYAHQVGASLCDPIYFSWNRVSVYFVPNVVLRLRWTHSETKTDLLLS